MTFRAATAGPRGLVAVILGVVVITFGAQLAWADTYTVRDGDTLSGVAQRLGVPVGALATANGLDDPDFIVSGRVLKVPSPLGSVTEYEVRPGDTLWDISSSVGVPVGQLAAANGLDDPDWVPAGRVLTVPRGGTTLGRAAAPATTAAATGGGSGAGVGTSGRYTVRSGDALSDIAWRAGVPVSQLAAANGITDPSFLAVGQVLTLPPAWDCPVPGASFVNDYAYVRPDGSGRHEGVDLFASRGTPIVAPVGGTVQQYPNPSGGLAVQLYGRDGNRYYFAHLDRYGEGGAVSRGAVIGYVGTTGDARATSPHLHFEIHPGGGAATTNPYPALVSAC